MATVLERAYEHAQRASRAADEEIETLPAVDPDSDDLDDLFAWGAAVAKRGNLTPEKSKEILCMVRENARGGR